MTSTWILALCCASLVYLLGGNMSTSETSIRTEANSSVVARNYAFILVGGFFFPLWIVAHFIARKRSRQPAGFEQSHYQFQYRTTSVALIVLIVLTLIGLALMSWMAPASPVDLVRHRMRVGLLSQAGWLLLMWMAIRAIRGLYLSGGNRAIHSPKTLWVWPR